MKIIHIAECVSYILSTVTRMKIASYNIKKNTIKHCKNGGAYHSRILRVVSTFSIKLELRTIICL